MKDDTEDSLLCIAILILLVIGIFIGSYSTDFFWRTAISEKHKASIQSESQQNITF